MVTTRFGLGKKIGPPLSKKHLTGGTRETPVQLDDDSPPEPATIPIKRVKTNLQGEKFQNPSKLIRGSTSSLEPPSPTETEHLSTESEEDIEEEAAEVQAETESEKEWAEEENDEQQSEKATEEEAEEVQIERQKRKRSRSSLNKRKSRMVIPNPPRKRLSIEEIQKRTVAHGRTIHHPTIQLLRIHEDVRQYLTNIGWEEFWTLDTAIFAPLVHEFYSTFTFSRKGEFSVSTAGTIAFTLRGQQFTLSITEFNVMLGFVQQDEVESATYLESWCDYPLEFNSLQAFRELIEDETTKYDPSKTKDHSLVDHALQYLHRLIAFNFSGRINIPSIMSKQELLFLWCMKHKKRVNFGFWMAEQVHRTAPMQERTLPLGMLITNMAFHHGLIDPAATDLERISVQALDMDSLKRIKIVEQKEKDSSHPACSRDKAPAPPMAKRQEANLADRLRKLEEQQDERDAQLQVWKDSMETKATRVENLLEALLNHLGGDIPDTIRTAADTPPSP